MNKPGFKKYERPQVDGFIKEGSVMKFTAESGGSGLPWQGKVGAEDKISGLFLDKNSPDHVKRAGQYYASPAYQRIDGAYTGEESHHETKIKEDED